MCLILGYKMDLKKHIRHCLLWLYDKDNSISSVAASEELRQSIQEWMESRPAGFWVMGFTDLPNRWAKVIEYEGDYFPDE